MMKELELLEQWKGAWSQKFSTSAGSLGQAKVRPGPSLPTHSPAQQKRADWKAGERSFGMGEQGEIKMNKSELLIFEWDLESVLSEKTIQEAGEHRFDVPDLKLGQSKEKIAGALGITVGALSAAIPWVKGRIKLALISRKCNQLPRGEVTKCKERVQEAVKEHRREALEAGFSRAILMGAAAFLGVKLGRTPSTEIETKNLPVIGKISIGRY